MKLEHTIDKEGIDGRWRVYWIRPDGYGTERIFGSREAAERWLEEMNAIDAFAPNVHPKVELTS